MELKLIRQTTGVGILLTVEDAVKAYKDPERLQNEIGSMLLGGGIDPETGDQMPMGLLIEDNGIRPHLTNSKPQALAAPVKEETQDESNHHCPECGARFKSAAGRAAHRRAKHGSESLSCPACGKTYKSQAWLDRHIKATHEEPEEEPEAEPEKVPAIGKLPADLPEWLEEYIGEGDDEDEDGND